MSQKKNLSSFLLELLISRVSTSRLAIPLVMASLVGALTGFVLVGFIRIIEILEKFFFTTLPAGLHFFGPYVVILIPAFGAVFVGLIVTFVSSEAKGHGVPEVMKAITLQGGRIRPVVVAAKAVASAIAIGSGASVGREGPIVQVGSALGSNIGQIFRLSESRVKNLVACGAAAGIAGVFNAPIAGVMFSLEVILRDFGARALSTVVVAAVSSSIVSRIFLGESPAFVAPVYSLWSPWEIVLYLCLGILSAFAAVGFSRLLHKSEEAFEHWKFPDWLKPAVGGLLVGGIGFFYPQVFGSGLHTIERVLHGDLTLQLLLILFVVKMAATSLCLGSGTSGGVFAPALFIGAVLGGSVGNLFYQRCPFPVAPPGAYALVGMASVFAAAAHAPVTAILIVFEMTGDYRMILPIMVAVVIATSLSMVLQRESIYTLKLKDRGIDIERMEEVQVLGAIQVQDAMSTDFVTIPRSFAVKDLADRMAKEKHKTFFVVNSKDELLGVIPPEKLQEVLFEKDLPLFIADDLLVPCRETCHPDDALTESAHMMMHQNITQLPVLQASGSRKVAGVLKSENVFRAYTEMSVKRSNLIIRMEEQDASASGTIKIHFQIPARCSLVDKTIFQLQIPHGIILTSIRRRNKILVPEGDTALKARDKIWAVIIPDKEADFKRWLKENGLDKHSVFE